MTLRAPNADSMAPRMQEAVAALRALLSAHLPPREAAPLAVYATLSGGRAAQALLHLLAHRSMAELAASEGLVEQVLGLISTLAGASDLMQLLTQGLRFSNEDTCLAQVKRESKFMAVSSLFVTA
jgi:hypothetical protein